MKPFFGNTESPSAPIFGAPDLFDFEQWLVAANEIRFASAFGHISGWRKVEGAIRKSEAKSIDILLGQAFFQTEVKLLLELRNLQKVKPNIRVRLASAVCTFHPKVWVVRNGTSLQAIVGSSNLSNGGFSTNIEANLFTGNKGVVDEISRSFADNWSVAHELHGTFFDKYVDEYAKLDQQRILLRKKIEQSQENLATLEAKWRKHEAIEKACKFWETEAGLRSVQENDQAINEIRKILRFPDFDFAAEDYSEFVHRTEFGTIRLGWYKKTIAALPKLKVALHTIGKTEVRESYDALDNVYGIGPNLASKLLAIYDPQQFVVVNSPVERALLSFGFSQEELNPMNGGKYEKFLRALDPFLEEARIRHLMPAAALDAFFYVYRDAAQ